MPAAPGHPVSLVKPVTKVTSNIASPRAANDPAPMPASITQTAPGVLQFSGTWTVGQLGKVVRQLDTLLLRHPDSLQLDGQQIQKIDSITAWIVQSRLKKLRDSGVQLSMQGWPAQYQKMLDGLSDIPPATTDKEKKPGLLERTGKAAVDVYKDNLALLSFIGETAMSLLGLFFHPRRWRGRTILHNIQIAGFAALPIVGVTSFLLGIVIAYQGADQLKHYGANIFVVELVGYAMLREFAPLITAIIIAGRSGSAYAAQIGTMVVTEEIDALQTIGIKPIELLVLPKLVALMLALPLLTLFADLIGVVGGMLMAASQLDVGMHEFIDRFATEIPLKTLLIGIGKSLVFAIVIVVIGCFQGFRTRGNADSVGRQTTRSVVQAIFIVIVLDAVFSVIFNLLGL
ncbi:MlaE family ABC transporter permease [Undibacterium pigrum]|uniref:Phospholipid/cholesterol/gamma-HCH transport system permease protein n=1 Tax=Undibacterium pigrum TaxID=401470 RepID=A0A318IRW3_9BURK|nr:ABC transporter permease [Undibacterium pigrum]PXX37763.1 phospholipid/cholesterol/gamma-HCH transport system permease protein [Undibacterium pigrum]